MLRQFVPIKALSLFTFHRIVKALRVEHDAAFCFVTRARKCEIFHFFESESTPTTVFTETRLCCATTGLLGLCPENITIIFRYSFKSYKQLCTVPSTVFTMLCLLFLPSSKVNIFYIKQLLKLIKDLRLYIYYH